MSQRINPNLYPSGGYFFQEGDGSVHKAPSWNGVFKKVEDYRRRAGRPLGDAPAEVIAQACQRNPALCYSDSSAPPPPPVILLKARVFAWMDGFLKMVQRREPIRFVEPAESKARANVCASCPKNTPLGVNTCAACKETLKNFRDALIGSRVRDARLGGCSVLGVDLVTASHFDEIRVENPALPNHCWRKRSI